IEDMVFTPGLDYMREILPALRSTYQSSSIHAQLTATLSGYGLCVLPYFIASSYEELVPVLPGELQLEREYWLNCHDDVVAAPRIRMLRDFILRAVNDGTMDFMGQELVSA